jgi:hypothetical protein
MAQWLNADAAFGTVASSYTAGGSTISVTMSQGTFPSPSAGQQFAIVVNPNVNPASAGVIPTDNATTERAYVTAVSGTGPYTLTLQSGGLANNHSVGEYVVQVISSAELSNFVQATASSDVSTSGVLSGTANVESIIRANTLNQMGAPTATVSFNSQRLSSLAAPQATTDAARALGSQIGFTRYAPTSSYSKTISSSTGAAIDSTNLTVSFTAISAQVLVELAATVGFFSGYGTIGFALYTHSTTTQMGNWGNVITTTAANEVTIPVTCRIYVSGLTAGTAYQWDWGWAVAGGSSPTALLVSLAAAGASFAGTDYGEIYMRVLAQ